MFILRSRLLFSLKFRGVWSEQSESCFVWIHCEIVMLFPGKELYVRMVVCISWLHTC